MGEQRKISPIEIDSICEDLIQLDPYDFEKRMMEYEEEIEADDFKTLKRVFKAYKKQYSSKPVTVFQNSMTDFDIPDGKYKQLNAGMWQADDNGIRVKIQDQSIEACFHPIMPVELLSNVDTRTEKIKLAFTHGEHWKEICIPRSTIASSTAIVKPLADAGVSITTETSKYLVKYLQDVENLNRHILPRKESISRLGWIEGIGFSPYTDKLTFDGNDNLKSSFEAVGTHGKYAKWIECMKQVRAHGTVGKILLASSFASVLIHPLKKLNFIVHLWGETGVAKSVSMMMAASVWANPNEDSGYIKNFNSTQVGLEMSASFCNSLPLCLQELQIVNDKDNIDKEIYMLCEGVGKIRGTKDVEMRKQGSWKNIILTNGEKPIVGELSGGGAANRIIEVYSKQIFEDAPKVADTVRANYGHAGKQWIQWLEDPKNMLQVQDVYDKVYAQIITQIKTTSKQSMSAALLVTADYFVTKLIFNDEHKLTVNEISTYLADAEQISSNARGYEHLLGFVSMNPHRFKPPYQAEAWGNITEDGEWININGVKFTEEMKKIGINGKALLQYLHEHDMLRSQGDKFRYSARVDGQQTTCVSIRNKKFDFIPTDEPHPFGP